MRVRSVAASSCLTVALAFGVAACGSSDKGGSGSTDTTTPGSGGAKLSGSITLAVNGREVEIDSRPSDALAIAVRSGAPIFAAEDVIAESAIEFEHEVEDTEEVVDRFKEFLDQVTPEDFAGGQ